MSTRLQQADPRMHASAGGAMAVTLHPLATEAAVNILTAGGNAMDAAVGASFVLGVVEPFNSGLGGLTSLMYFDHEKRRTFAVDGTSCVPRGLTAAWFPVRDRAAKAGVYGWSAVEDDRNNTGYLSMVVPGTPAALSVAHAEFGRLPLREVMQGAIALAEEGLPVDWYQGMGFAWAQDRLARFDSSRRIFFGPGGYALRPPFLGSDGDRLVQTDLGASLRAIADGGGSVFYRGELGRKITSALQSGGGLITSEEFAEYAPRVWTEVGAGEYRGHVIAGPPDNTGVPTLLEALGILERFDLRSLGHNTVASLHLIAEALRRSFADRLAFLGEGVAAEAFYDRGHVKARAAEIDPVAATPSVHARDPRTGVVAASPAKVLGSTAADADTTHISVVDGQRNVASVTSTIGGHFGSAVVAEGTGVVMNNGLMWFDPVPEHPNSIQPGRRIVVAGTPVVVFRQGEPVMTLGAAGGRKIISAAVQMIVNSLEFGLSTAEIVGAPRIHCEGPQTVVDARLGSDVIDGLKRLGHQVVVRAEDLGSSWLARPNCIRIQPDGELEAAVHQLARGSARAV